MKKKLVTALITGIACGSLVFAGCGDNKSDSSSSASSSVATSSNSSSSSSAAPTKESKKSMSESEKKAKIEQLSQGMDVKGDDMTGATGYTGSGMQQILPILRKEITDKGYVPSYRLCALKDKDGNKHLMEIIELDSKEADVMEDKLVMKSKDKLYTTSYDQFDGNTESVNDFQNDISISGVRSIAKKDRIKEIREAVNSGYIKIRVSDVMSHKNFDRELTSEEINMLSKVLQIYDLL